MPQEMKSVAVPKSAPKKQKRQGGRPTLADARALSENILQVATDHFLDLGYHGTTFDGVAKQAGTSKGALYLRYPEKVALFSAVCERLISQLYQADIIESDQDLPIRACLEKQGRALITAALNPVALDLYKMITNDAPQYAELNNSTEAVWDFYVDQMDNYFTKRIRLGRLLMRDTRRAAQRFAQMIFGPVHVALIHGKRLPDHDEINIHVAETVLIFLGGIGRLEMESMEG